MTDVKYCTRGDWRLRSDMESAPLGTKLLLLTIGETLVIGVLSKENLQHFKQWSQLPKKALT